MWLRQGIPPLCWLLVFLFWVFVSVCFNLISYFKIIFFKLKFTTCLYSIWSKPQNSLRSVAQARDPTTLLTPPQVIYSLEHISRIFNVFYIFTSLLNHHRLYIHKSIYLEYLTIEFSPQTFEVVTDPFL